MITAPEKIISKDLAELPPGKSFWNANLYDDKHSFVSRYGENIVELLNPQPGEKILDIGCGTGYLTNLISERGAAVTGIDSSKEMIAKAKSEFPDIDFRVLSATDFHFNHLFDAVFSNATLHWVLEKQKVINCICENLKPGGRLVIEMGGKGNVENIINAVKRTLTQYGYTNAAEKTIWYFPSLSEYTSLLEDAGFRVTYAAHYDRETKLQDNANGIKDWLEMFGSSFFKEIDVNTINDVLNKVQDILKPVLFKNGNWYADYKRLRVIAIKQNVDC